MNNESATRIAEMVAARHTANTSGQSNILDSADQYLCRFAPFQGSDYAHADAMRVGPARKLLDLAAKKPGAIWSPDPFARSKFRENGMAVWDSAVAIPLAKMRGKKVGTPNSVKAIRACNKHWIENIVPAMQSLQSPAPIIVPGLVDLRHNPRGWDYLRAAHVLAHRRAASIKLEGTCSDYGRMAALLRTSLAEVMFSIMFNVPMQTRPFDTRSNGMPNAVFGIRLETSGHLEFASLRVPYNTAASPVPDKTLVYVLCAMHTAPNPYLFRDPGFAPTALHAWAGLPTVVAFAGWEGVDAVCHQRLCRQDADKLNPSKPAEYIMPADDLMSADTLRSLLELGELRLGRQAASDGWELASSWMRSDDFKAGEAITPPLPCLECVNYGYQAVDALRRPFGDPDDPTKRDEWAAYAEDIRRVLDISSAMAAKAEAFAAGIPLRTRERDRKRCGAAYRKLAARDAEIAALARIVRRRNTGAGFTETGRKLYFSGVDKYGEAFVNSLGDA